MNKEIVVVTAAYGAQTVRQTGGQLALLDMIKRSGAQGVEIRQELLTPDDSLQTIRNKAHALGLFTIYSAPYPLLDKDGNVAQSTTEQALKDAGRVLGFPYGFVDGVAKLIPFKPGKLVTLAYVEPGVWVGEAEVLYGRPCTYEAHAHGPTTLLSVPETALRSLLQQHPTFGEALLTLQAWSMRSLYTMMEDVATMPLRARLAKQLLHLLERFGAPYAEPQASRPLGLSLTQDELAGLLGGSRQRVNVELKWLEQQGLISVRPRGVEVHDAAGLQTLVDQAADEGKTGG